MTKAILIVDDEPLILSSLSKAMGGGEVMVKTVSNGIDALREVSEAVYDLCFLDLNLTDSHGFDIMQKIKELSPRTKVVIMTGSEISAEERKAIDEEAYSFISKPFELSYVRDVVKQALEGPPQGLEKRRSIRRPFTGAGDYAVSLLGLDGSEQCSLPVHIMDISDGGLGIRTSYPLEKGSMLSINGLAGVVRWGAPLGVGSDYRFGIELFPI
ncbi:MAG: response regulator [Nitrospirota bacterium]